MDDHEINITLAEWCGGKWYRCEELKTTSFLCKDWVLALGPVGMYKWVEIARPEDWKKVTYYGPKYATDLNAMHEAESTIFNPKQWETYTDWIITVQPKDQSPLRATARQRSECLLRTVNLYRE